MVLYGEASQGIPAQGNSLIPIPNWRTSQSASARRRSTQSSSHLSRQNGQYEHEYGTIAGSTPRRNLDGPLSLSPSPNLRGSRLETHGEDYDSDIGTRELRRSMLQAQGQAGSGRGSGHQTSKGASPTLHPPVTLLSSSSASTSRRIPWTFVESAVHSRSSPYRSRSRSPSAEQIVSEHRHIPVP